MVSLYIFMPYIRKINAQYTKKNCIQMVGKSTNDRRKHRLFGQKRLKWTSLMILFLKVCFQPKKISLILTVHLYSCGKNGANLFKIINKYQTIAKTYRF